MTTTKTAESNSYLRSCFVGTSCGCIYPLLLLIFVLGLSWYLLADTQKLIRTPIKLMVVSPKQEDFWKLKEKRDSFATDASATATATIELTPSEFNAFLSAYTFKPYRGYFLDKMRFLSAHRKGTFFLIGSGMFLRSLIISINLSFTGECKITSVKINSWKVPDDSFIFTNVLKFIAQLFIENKYNVSYIKSQSKFIKIENGNIIIPKSIVFFKKTAEK